MTTVPMFSLLYSSCMMHHVFIMFLWLVFIDKLHNDNSVHVLTIVFIMCDMPCIQGVYSWIIHSFKNIHSNFYSERPKNVYMMKTSMKTPVAEFMVPATT